MSAGPADEVCEQLGETIAELELAMAEQENRGTELLGQVNNARDRRNLLSAQLDDARGQLQVQRGRQASLEALQQAAAGAGEAVEDWLSERQLQSRPRLLEQIQVQPEWQQAVETVLGDNLRAVCVEQIDQLQADLAQAPRGKLVLVEQQSGASPDADSLAAKVSGIGNIQALLGDVLTATDLASALQRRSALQTHQSLITSDGIWIGPNWVRVPDRGEESGGVIARQQELEELAQARQSTEHSCAELEQELASLAEQLKQLEQQRHQAQEQLQAATREQAQNSAQLSAEQAKIEQISKRRQAINRDIDESRGQFGDEQENLAEARQLLSAAIESMEADSHRRESLLSQRDTTRSMLDQARQAARHDKDAAHQTAMQHQSLQAQLDSMLQSIERTDAQVQQLLERKENLLESISSNDSPLEGLQVELAGQLEARLGVEAELAEARSRVAGVDHDLREAETQRGAIEQRSSAVRSELEKLKLDNQTLQVQRQTLEQQLREGEHTPEEVLQGLPEHANEGEWQRLLEQVGNRITRLGPINLAAIDEYSQQSERKNYLDAQNEDLENALQTLESAIRKIDRETRNRFRETFEDVNSSLQELFPRVFGGGSAYLEMTGDDLLDTGITIMARPPGKKNATIHLLSGGEKALTAIALVFSIFRLNPAPFCMLDEVDAPLDDANTGRYARMVKEMSDQVQFIFITHNKITMEMADQLMGVTMQEPGVSRLVTVDVEEAAELAAS